MTYILAGKLNNKPFICVDKVVNLNPNNPPQNKLYSFISNPHITISLSGDSVLMDAIKDHDKDLHKQGEVLVIDENLMNDFAVALEGAYDPQNLGDNYVYVIDGNNLTRYDLIFPADDHTEYANCTSINVNEGEFLSNTNRKIKIIPPNDIHAQLFSASWLKDFYQERFIQGIEKYTVNEYFKDGLNFYTIH